MKTKLKILSLLVVGLISCQSQYAQLPSMNTTAYSNSEIDVMLQKYQSEHSRDIVPPIDLQQKFATDFPSANDIDWEIAANIYEVEFKIKRKDYKAFYDEKGVLLMYSQKINKSELPAIVKNAAENKYPKYRFEDIKVIRRGTEIFYKIEMEHQNMEVKFVLKNDGSIVNERFDH